MGDIDDIDPELFLDLLDLKPHPLAEDRVQIGERLIQQQDPGLRDKGPSQGDPLLLPAGKLGGHTLREPAQMDDLQDLFHLFPGLFLWPFADLERISHIVKDIHVRPDSIGLKDHTDPPLLRRDQHIPGTDQVPVDPDLPGRRLLKPRDHPQHCRLAASRRS